MVKSDSKDLNKNPAKAKRLVPGGYMAWQHN